MQFIIRKLINLMTAPSARHIAMPPRWRRISTAFPSARRAHSIGRSANSVARRRDRTFRERRERWTGNAFFFILSSGYRRYDVYFFMTERT